MEPREVPSRPSCSRNQRITLGDGVRDVRHIELSLAGSGSATSRAIRSVSCAENPPVTVAAVLAAARLDGAADRRTRRPVGARSREWLAIGLEITLRHAAADCEASRSAPGTPALAQLLKPGQEAALRAS